MNTISTILSRLRTKSKSLNKDGFITDRILYSIVKKFVPALLKREDSKNLLQTIQGIFQTLEYVELVEVDKVSSKCFKLETDCTIKRTKHRLPGLYMGYAAPLIKSITSLSGFATDNDDEGDVSLVEAIKYSSIVKVKSFKYNKTKYCWYSDGYLWFPNIEWDAVKIEGLFEEDISDFNCDHCKSCKPRQDHPFSVPEYLYPELEGFVFEELGLTMKIPSDTIDDKQNLNRQ